MSFENSIWFPSIWLMQFNHSFLFTWKQRKTLLWFEITIKKLRAIVNCKWIDCWEFSENFSNPIQRFFYLNYISNNSPLILLFNILRISNDKCACGSSNKFWKITYQPMLLEKNWKIRRRINIPKYQSSVNFQYLDKIRFSIVCRHSSLCPIVSFTICMSW